MERKMQSECEMIEMRKQNTGTIDEFVHIYDTATLKRYITVIR